MQASELSKVDAIAFDCDGVLVDARKSYDEAIRVVAEKMVAGLTGRKVPLAKAAPELIAMIRRTGGFNSDWDSTYAITLFTYIALREKTLVTATLRNARDIASSFASEPRRGGVTDLDAFLTEEFPSLSEDLAKAREYLGFPGRPPKSRLAALFDQLYLGRSLYRQYYGVDDGPKKGFIDMERVLITNDTFRSLEEMVGVGRLAMVTGRPSKGTAYTFGKRMTHFDKEASIFIGDADVYPRMKAAYAKFRKPRPDGLIRASEKLSSRMLLYAGDSAEDLMMVKDAQAKGMLENCVFAGVYGMSPDPKKQVSFFEENGADIIVKSVNEIPSRLLMASSNKVTQAN